LSFIVQLFCCFSFFNYFCFYICVRNEYLVQPCEVVDFSPVTTPLLGTLAIIVSNMTAAASTSVRVSYAMC
ncbi:hypothetical protein, partial [Bacillus sp. PBIB7]|uniref:hypothetical protein n=1 Tax=Bacillus sp. PBIB7 TaxID=3140354 RepID=UPI0031F32B55